jgi:hypothetical protein
MNVGIPEWLGTGNRVGPIETDRDFSHVLIPSNIPAVNLKLDHDTFRPLVYVAVN